MGQHCGRDPKTGRDKVWSWNSQDNIIETDLHLDRLNAPGYQPKYQRIDWEEGAPQGVVLPPNSQVWDPAKETVQQFADRMGKMTVPQAAPGNPQTVDESARAGFNTAFADAAKGAPATVQAQAPTGPRRRINGSDKDYFAALDKMTLKELQSEAEAEEVDLKNSKDRAEIVKLIKANYGAASAK